MLRNSQNNHNHPPSTHSNKLSLICLLLFQFVGLTTSLVLLFINLTSNYLAIFDFKAIDSCIKSSQYNYLNNISVIYRIIVSEIALCILFFAVLLILCSFRLKNSLSKEKEPLFLYKKIINILLILAAGCLFGNFVKLTVSLAYVSFCSSNYQYITSVYYNCLNSALLSGICLLLSLITFFICPIVWNQQSNPYIDNVPQQLQVNENSNKITTNNISLNRELQSKGGQMPLRQEYGIQTQQISQINLLGPTIINKPNKQQIESPTNKKKRIFGRSLLAQSKYALSVHKSEQALPPESIKTINSRFGTPRNTQIQTLEINKRTNLNSSPMKSSHLKQSRVVESYTVNISEGPPLQLGRYEPSMRQNDFDDRYLASELKQK